MIKVLDACAMIAYLRGEPGAEIVEALLLDKSNQCLAHVVNLCEVYYDFLRAKDEASALGAIAYLNSVGVIARDDIDTQFWQDAGKHKATIKKDFFCGLLRSDFGQSDASRARDVGSS